MSSYGYDGDERLQFMFKTNIRDVYFKKVTNSCEDMKSASIIEKDQENNEAISLPLKYVQKNEEHIVDDNNHQGSGRNVSMASNEAREE